MLNRTDFMFRPKLILVGEQELAGGVRRIFWWRRRHRCVRSIFAIATGLYRGALVVLERLAVRLIYPRRALPGADFHAIHGEVM